MAEPGNNLSRPIYRLKTASGSGWCAAVESGR
jgi:hypothetical protein